MRIEILGVGFDNITKEEAVQEAVSLLDSGGCHYVVTPNPEIVEICREREEVARAVNGADLVLPDGIGIIKGAEILGTPLRERVPGIEFASALMERLAKTEYSIYFLGGKPGIAVEAAKNLSRQYPGLRCAGFRDGYFRKDAPVVEDIRRSKADVVFVCLGAPKQELWMLRNGPDTGAKLLCGLGGSLDIFAGVSKRAPAFFCDHGLEWFYRLCKEPWRWKRMMKLPIFLRHVRQEKRNRKAEPIRKPLTELVKPMPVEPEAPSETPLPVEPEPATATPFSFDISTEPDAPQDTLLSVEPETPLSFDMETPLSDEPETPQNTLLSVEPEVPPPPEAESLEEISPDTGSSTEEPMPDFEHQDTTQWNPNDVNPPRRRRRKSRVRWYHTLIYFFVVVLISVILAGIGWELASDLCAFNRGAVTTHTVEITPGDSLDQVITKLERAGLIKYPFFFRLFAEVTHAESKIGAGTYALNTDMDYRALVVGMRSSAGLKTSEVKVTIPEGYTVRDICALLAEKGVASEDELLDAACNAPFDYDFIDNDSHEISRLEGFLFPDTYDFYTPENPQRALNRLLSNFARKIEAWEDLLAEADQRGYDLKKIVTIASLIEKETDGSDQARIASVVYNRLDGPGSRAGTYGLLQIDAALLYGIPNHSGPITSADLEYSSPYNLYKNAGLPPTPIANPGAQSIYAALSPEESDYYYYALAKDNKHRFFSNYTDFSHFLSSSDYIGN